MKLIEVISTGSVAYHLSKEGSDVELYHGSTTSLGLSIGDYILPPNRTDTISEFGRKKNLDVIFLTPDFNYAKVYAGRAANSIGGSPVIFKVKPVGLEFYRQEQGNNIYIADGGFIVNKYTP